MRYTAVLFLVLFGLQAESQENYSTLTRKALEAMWKAKDEAGYKKSLEMYEMAFRMYPDSIDGTGLYKTSVLASMLKDHDKAFQYLAPLAGMNTDESGYPGWRYIVGKYSETEFINLLSDTRWHTLKQQALKDKAVFYNDLKNKENEFYNIKPDSLEEIKDPEILYEKMRCFNPYQKKLQRDYSVSFKIKDSANTSFFVHLPVNYDPVKKYPLLFFLHGAVRNNALADFQLVAWNLGGWNRYYTKYADQNEVILVFPKASRQYNWMTPDDGFFMIPEMLAMVKKGINIDDNKVFISGHSNGATGSFSYLVKQPTPFAGFYGFNTYPKVFTGGTFINNITNRSFINFSTDQDYYYPPNANDDFTKLLNGLNADYSEYRYNGFPHWFPKFDESEPAYQILFNDLRTRERDPFPKKISWEFDDERYGNIDWISDMKLDSSGKRADWHKELNFKITSWLEYDKKDSLKKIVVDKNAFDFPRKSGKIMAEYQDNIFRLKTSGISSLRINISPRMVNLEEKVCIYINEKLYFSDKIEYDPSFMLRTFKEKQDREQIWVNFIEVKI